MVLILVTEMALVIEMSVKALIGVVLHHSTSWKTRGGAYRERSPEGTAAFGGPEPFFLKPSSSAQYDWIPLLQSSARLPEPAGAAGQREGLALTAQGEMPLWLKFCFWK